MYKNGFSIAEFVISITIMFVVAVAALPILMQKSKDVYEQGKGDGSWLCSCETEQYKKNGYCDFTFKKDSKAEFYTIQMLGGGAGGGVKRGGGAGEARVVHYPGLDGEYRIILGKGGAGSSSSGVAPQNGGQTLIYKKNYVKQDNTKVEKYTLVEYAKGGITGQEDAPENAYANGEAPAFSETTNHCGSGGNAGESGKDGEVVIRW